MTRPARPIVSDHRQHWLAIAIALTWLHSAAICQLRISGQASSAFIRSNDGFSQYAVDHGRPTFMWRLDLFADAAINENIYFLSNVRIHQDQILRFDLFAVKITDIASTGVNIELGEIELPFGNLGERRFPRSNPFYQLPLINEHLTTLLSSKYELWLPDARYTADGNGVRILDQGLYDLGLKVYGGVGMFDYWISVVNGMVSATSTYSLNYGASGLNTNSGFGSIVRLAATPVTGLTLGSSFATGPFLPEGTFYSQNSNFKPAEITQQAIEGDIDFSFGHAAFYGQAVYSVWRLAEEIGSDLRAIGYSAEGRYIPMPRITLAARAGGLHFNSVVIDTYSSDYSVQRYTGKWDHDVFRLEGAVGYRLDRALLVKIIYEWNKSLNAPDPVDNVLVFQTVLGF